MKVKTKESVLDNILSAIDEAQKDGEIVDEIILTKNEAIELYNELKRWKWLDFLDIFAFDFFLDVLEDGLVFNGALLKYEKEVTVD